MFDTFTTLQTLVFSCHVWFLPAILDRKLAGPLSSFAGGKLMLGKAALQMRVCRASVLSVGKAAPVLRFRVRNSGMPL